MANNGTQKKKMSSMEIDAIGEILNISLGSSATAASTMLNARVDITTPIVEVKSKDEFEFSNLEPAIGVEITYVEGLTGSNVMLLKRNDVKIIVEMMMGMEIPDGEFELNEMNISAICEIMNQMMGASATALAELLSRTVNISTPVSFEVANSEQFKEKYFQNDEPMVVIRFSLKISDKMESEFLNVMPIPLAKELVSGFFPDGSLEEAEEEAEAAAPEAAPASGGGDAVLDQAAIEKLMADAESAASAAPEQPAPEAAAPTGGGDAVLDQAAIEKLMADAESAAPAAPEQPASEPAATTGGGDAVLDQAAIEKLMAETAASEPAPPASSATPTPAAPEAAPAQPVQPAVSAQAVPTAPSAPAAPVGAPMDAASASMMQQMMDMMRQQMELQQQELEHLKGMQKAAAAPKQIKVNAMPQPNLTSGEGELDPDANLDLIMGVPLDVSVEIGRTKKLVKDILEFNKGTLVVLNKLAGEQVDVFVNGQCIAKGDVVVVEDNFGVRITEIIQEEIEIEP